MVRHTDVEVTGRKEEGFIVMPRSRRHTTPNTGEHREVGSGAEGVKGKSGQASTLVSVEETGETGTQAWESSV